MEKEFVPHEQALELKELGFDEPCFGRYYTNDATAPIYMPWTKREGTKFNSILLPIWDYEKLSPFISAPLYQQAFRFFNEKYGLYHYNIRRDYYISEDGVRSYDDIELECLKKLIEIAKEK